MIVRLDTNVISELMRPEPNAAVLAWVASQPREMLDSASIVQTEILYGIALLPEGRRKVGLASAAAALFAEDFAGRVLPYDSQAARHYANLIMDRRGAGALIETFDALIAPTACAAGTAIATRDVDGFQECAIAVIDPWSATTAA